MIGAYYNEHDPFAAAWLRELIKDGLIAPGEVDERDIRDVIPNDLRSFRQVHLFAGIGIWSAALRGAGWPDHRSVWTLSAPCQPFSQAGKGGGFDDERHLWPAAFHLISQCGPNVVLGEQSSSKDGLAWFDLVSADMEAAGYAGGAIDLCSAGFGAPNIRQRNYFVWVADAAGKRHDGRGAGEALGYTSEPERPCHAGRMAHPNIEGPQRRDGMPKRPLECVTRRSRLVGGLAHADGRDASAEGLQRGGQHGQRAQDGSAGRMAYADHARPSCAGSKSQPQSAIVKLGDDSREEGKARPRPVNGFWGASDWIGCTDGKWRPVEPGTFPLASGYPNRVGILRGAGNALNKEVAQGFIEAVSAYLAASERMAA